MIIYIPARKKIRFAPFNTLEMQLFETCNITCNLLFYNVSLNAISPEYLAINLHNQLIKERKFTRDKRMAHGYLKDKRIATEQ